jgi:hypothetical protein
MKIRNPGTPRGRLFVFQHPETAGKSFGLFFSGQDIQRLHMLKAAREGFEAVLPEALPGWTMDSCSISDLDNVQYEVEGLDPDRVVRFCLEDFVDTSAVFYRRRAEAALKRLAASADLALPDLRAGSVATGADFFNREKELAALWENAEKGKDSILRAPRRYGKTSLARRLCADPRPGWSACYVDLEGGQSPEDFVFSIFRELFDTAECMACAPPGCAPEDLKGLTADEKADFRDKKQVAIEEDWKKEGDALFALLNLEKSKLLIILDEFSFLADNIYEKDKNELHSLLEWFETIQQNKKKELAFIISGSEHLPTYLESIGLGKRFSNLAPVHLGTFDEETAKDYIFLSMARQNIQLSPDECGDILSIIGKPIPYFLQLFLDALAKKCLDKKKLDHGDIEHEYRCGLLGVDGKRHFESIFRQLDHYGRKDKSFTGAAEDVLSALAHGPVRRETLQEKWRKLTGDANSFQWMFDLMRDDFYLAEENGKIRFDSTLLKDWWRLRARRPFEKQGRP